MENENMVITYCYLYQEGTRTWPAPTLGGPIILSIILRSRKSPTTCSGLRAAATRASSLGLGREGTSRGLAGELLALRTAWGGGDAFH